MISSTKEPSNLPVDKVDCESNNGSDSDEVKNCNKLKRKKFILGDHIKIIEDNPVVYFCSICKHKFKWKRQGAYHQYCTTGKRPLKCKFCPKRFVTNSHLQYHLLSHSGELPYQCASCDKAYKQKDKLIRHQKIHLDSGLNKQACSVCNKLLSNASSLKVHMLTHSTDRPFKCQHCHKGYTTEYEYKRHLLKHSGAYHFVCEQCGKSFPRKFNLTAHYLIHSVLRPYKCTLCDCAFKKKYELSRHVKQHESVAEYECNLCLTKFSRKDNLLRHARNTHPGEKVTIKMNGKVNGDPAQIDYVPPVRTSVIVTSKTLLLQDREPVIQLAPPSIKGSTTK